MQKVLFSAFLMSGSILAASSAQAHQAPTDAAGVARDQSTVNDDNEVIIVTAQNRAENVQNVPIAISVVSGQALKSQGVTDFTSVQRVSPALQITTDQTNTRVTVRGVGSLTNNESQDQSIAVNIDGEYVNRPTILNVALFDIDRVEVLRGPQGTLYGRNSTGGAVNFITRKPREEFGANASATYGNYNQVIVEGGVDVPLGDIGAIRLAGIYSDHDGYVRHNNTPVTLPWFTPVSGGRSGDDHKWAGRASLRLTPEDGFTVDASVEHFEQDIHPASYAYADLNSSQYGPGAGCSNPGFVEVAPGVPGDQCIPSRTQNLRNVDRSTYDSSLTGISTFHQDSTAVRGRIAWDFGPATLTYTGGYRVTKGNGGTTLPPAYKFINFGDSVKTQSHELRVNGITSSVQWQGGVFYFKEIQNTNQGLYNPFIGIPGNTIGSYITYFRHPTTSESWSAFGQVEVPIIDKVTAVAGGRYTKDKRRAVFSNYGFVFNQGQVELTGPAPTVLNLRYSGDKFNYLAGINYKPTPDTLLYAKISTGYKAGGFDSVGVFKPETNRAYEGGLKLNFGDTRQHIFNIAGFYYQYKDLQNDVLLDSAVGNETFNAGKATIWGIEAETNIKLSPFDTFNASANYLHAQYDEFQATYNELDSRNPSVNTTGMLTNLAGNRLPYTPRWVIGLGYDHRFDLGNMGSVSASVYSRFKSEYFVDIFNYQDSRQVAYTQTDLSVEYKTENKKLAVQAFVRNLENKRPLVYASFVSAGPDDVYNWQFGQPRTYGLRVSLEY